MMRLQRGNKGRWMVYRGERLAGMFWNKTAAQLFIARGGK